MITEDKVNEAITQMRAAGCSESEIALAIVAAADFATGACAANESPPGSLAAVVLAFHQPLYDLLFPPRI